MDSEESGYSDYEDGYDMDENGKPTAAAVKAKQKHREAMKGASNKPNTSEEDSELEESEDDEEIEKKLAEIASESPDIESDVESDEDNEDLTVEEKSAQKEKKLAALAAAKEAHAKRKEDREKKKAELLKLKEEKAKQKEKKKAEKEEERRKKKAEKEKLKAEQAAKNAEKKEEKQFQKEEKNADKKAEKEKESTERKGSATNSKDRTADENQVNTEKKKKTKNKMNKNKANQADSNNTEDSDSESISDGESIFNEINDDDLDTQTTAKGIKSAKNVGTGKASIKNNYKPKQKNNDKTGNINKYHDKDNVTKKGKSKSRSKSKPIDDPDSSESASTKSNNETKPRGNSSKLRNRRKQSASNLKNKRNNVNRLSVLPSDVEGKISHNESESEDTDIDDVSSPVKKSKTITEKALKKNVKKPGTSSFSNGDNQTSKPNTKDQGNKSNARKSRQGEKSKTPRRTTQTPKNNQGPSEYEDEDETEYDSDEDYDDESYYTDSVDEEGTGSPEGVVNSGGNNYLVKPPAKKEKKSGGFFSSLFGGNKNSKKVGHAVGQTDENLATKPNGENIKTTHPGKRNIFKGNPRKKINYGDWDDSKEPTANANYSNKPSENVTRVPLLFRKSGDNAGQTANRPNDSYDKRQDNTMNTNDVFKNTQPNTDIPNGYQKLPDGSLQRLPQNLNPITPLGYEKINNGTIVKKDLNPHQYGNTLGPIVPMGKNEPYNVGDNSNSINTNDLYKSNSNEPRRTGNNSNSFNANDPYKNYRNVSHRTGNNDNSIIANTPDKNYSNDPCKTGNNGNSINANDPYKNYSSEPHRTGNNSSNTDDANRNKINALLQSNARRKMATKYKQGDPKTVGGNGDKSQSFTAAGKQSKPSKYRDYGDGDNIFAPSEGPFSYGKDDFNHQPQQYQGHGSSARGGSYGKPGLSNEIGKCKVFLARLI